MLAVGVYCRIKVVRIGQNGTGMVMEVLPHDQFIVRIDGLRRLMCRNRFLRLYNPVSTNTETKVINGWHKYLTSSLKGNVRNQHPDSPA